uniref:Uncharacterized protein n=1 Tax=Arundo donax TaxID=35708 RepID=A0A0A8Y0Q2_ARUDO
MYSCSHEKQSIYIQTPELYLNKFNPYSFNLNK